MHHVAAHRSFGIFRLFGFTSPVLGMFTLLWHACVPRCFGRHRFGAVQRVVDPKSELKKLGLLVLNKVSFGGRARSEGAKFVIVGCHACVASAPLAD